MQQQPAGQGDATQWWRGAVIYQVYPRSFADANGDGVGDLRGLTQRLPYIASLNVDAVWISPIFRSPMKDFGYDVSDYRDIDPLFGTLADFDECIAEAHRLGLKIMVDQVLSHTSDQHEWFRESRANRANPRADWYIWSDPLPDGTPPNNWQSVFGGSAWTWDARRKQYYLHNFLAAQPDLNFHNPAVQQQLLEDMEFWLRRGVDGFRFDTANYLHHDALLRSNPARHDAPAPQALPGNPYDMQEHVYDKNQPENIEFFRRARALLDQYGAASVGEVGDADALPLMLDYAAGHDRLHMTYSFAFLGEDNRAAHVQQQVQTFVEEDMRRATHSWPCWTVGNHDAARVLTRWRGTAAPQEFTRLQAAMLGALRGSVCWYQGDELALCDAELAFEQLQDPRGIAFWPEDKGRDGCRTPMPWNAQQVDAGFSNGEPVAPWLPVPAQHRTHAVDEMQRQPQAALHFLRAYWSWRRSQPALLRGSIEFLPQREDVLALVRRPVAAESGAHWLMLFNFSDAPVQFECSEAPQTTDCALPGLPAHQAGTRSGALFSLPAYGIYLGELKE